MFPKLIRLSLLMCLLAVTPVHAKVFKIATIAPEGTAWMKAMRAGAAEIKERTGGRVVFKFYPGGVMGNDENVLRKMRIGQLHGGAITSGSLERIYRDISIYNLPFLFSSFEQVDAARAGLDAKLIAGLEKKGFVSFGFAEGGFSYMMSDREMTTIESMQGRKVWIPVGNEVGEIVFGHAGISPVALPLSDVMTGLQTGLVDTVIASPIGALALQWHTRISFAVDLPLTYYTGTMVLSKRAFDRIKPEDRDIVREVMNDVFVAIDKQNREDNIAAKQALVNQGIRFDVLAPEVEEAWLEVGRKALADIEQKNGFTPALYDQLMGYVR